MYYTIYKITCKTTGKIYIGKHQTKDLQDCYMGSGKLLIRAQKKYGLENFSKKVLYVFDTEEEMNAKEAELVTEEFCLREDTYNICPGGQGGWGYVNASGIRSKNHTPEMYKKVSSTLKGRKMPWVGDNLKNYHQSGNAKYDNFKGKKHSDETKKIIGLKNSEKQKSFGNSQFGTMWITNGIENKKIKKTDSIPEGFRKGRIYK